MVEEKAKVIASITKKRAPKLGSHIKRQRKLLRCYIQLCFDHFFAHKYSTLEGYLRGLMQKWWGS